MSDYTKRRIAWFLALTLGLPLCLFAVVWAVDKDSTLVLGGLALTLYPWWTWFGAGLLARRKDGK